MKELLVVTGGSKGIGRAIIEKFLGHGFDVITCARNNDDLDQLKNDLSVRGNVLTFAADLSDKAQVEKFVDFIKGRGKPVDVLVNNAGFFIPGEITTEEDGVLEQMMNANLFSAYYLTRGLVGPMKERKSGHIFSMCSVASIKAYPNGGSYAIAKSALLGMTRCLREELKGYGIRVTAVIPGATKTASWDGMDLPDERFMRVEDVADLIYACYSISGRSVVEELLIRPQLGDI